MTGFARVTTFIGAGGKTTSIKRLGKEINATGQPVVLTTTTKVYPFDDCPAWQHEIIPPPLELTTGFWYARVEPQTGKWCGPVKEAVDKAIQAEANGRYWGIEGDGARCRRLKCWATYEPQIPQATECVVLVIDGGLWGKVLEADEVHRPEMCPDLIKRVFDGATWLEYVLRSPVCFPAWTGLPWVIMLNRWVPGAPGSDLEVIEELIRVMHTRRDRLPANLKVACGNVLTGKLVWGA